MVLNELSLQTTAPDITTARKWMSELIQTLRQATSSGVKKILRTSNEINSLEIAPKYPISKWRNDDSTSREEKQFFRTLTTKAPFWTDASPDIQDQFELSDVFCQEKSAKGLGFVLVIDGLAVSFQSHSKWNCSCLELQVSKLDEDGEIVDVVEEVKHASHINHIQDHVDWINNRLRVTVINGQDLWDRRSELFPSLQFCDDLQDQLQNLSSQHPMLQNVAKRLSRLEEYCKCWMTGRFSPDDVGNCSPESQATLQQYPTERTFRCPDGEKRLFIWHIKLANGWRIYILPIEPQKIVIGYIGPHLRTVKYRT